ncbi:MAG: hypothetical protein U0575_08860 [Phycisphaerales bacterium]
MRCAAIPFVLVAGTLAGCHVTPDVMPLQWFVGSTHVDPAGAEVFGPSGRTALSWEIERELQTWAWNENRPDGWRSRAAWMQQGPGFVAAAESGAWEGNIKIYDVQWGDDLYQPEAWDYNLVLVNGAGTIVGRGQIAGAQVFVDQRWLRPDGTVAATMHQEFTAADEEQYQRAVRELGGTPPP